MIFQLNPADISPIRETLVCIRICASHNSCIRDMSHPYVWHDSFECVTWLIYLVQVLRVTTEGAAAAYVWIESFICDMTDSYVWHDAFVCVTWLIHVYDIIVIIEYISHYYRIYVTWGVRMYDMTQFIREAWLHSYMFEYMSHYGVAMVSRIDKIIGLFCRIVSLL